MHGNYSNPVYGGTLEDAVAEYNGTVTVAGMAMSYDDVAAIRQEVTKDALVANPSRRKLVADAERALSNATPPNVDRVGFEVEGIGHHARERYILRPMYDSIGFAPKPGDVIQCSALGGMSAWHVVRVATGYPGSMTITG